MTADEIDTKSEHLQLARAIRLLRCPFCGAEACLDLPIPGHTINSVRCTGCGAVQIGEDVLEAVRRWQRRIDAELLHHFSAGARPPKLLRHVPYAAMSALAHWLARE